jgi:hypothetical protein
VNRLILILPFIGALSACGVPSLFIGSDPHDPPKMITQQDEDNAMMAVVVCFKRSAGQLDDSYSPATSIAVGMESACAGEWDNSVRIQSRNMNWQTQKLFREKMESEELKVATQVVLDERASTRRFSGN